MNKKQLTVMWMGIAIIVLLILFQSGVFAFIYAPGRVLEGILVLMISWRIVVIVAALTIGLICTFASKKGKKPNDEENNK
ncbi:MAG: hypothetical protein ACYS83_04200 [Planctomycetota bacterium]|jgi:uncharacterized membrane protein